jgi:hypothetical protein
MDFTQLQRRQANPLDERQQASPMLVLEPKPIKR